MLKIDFLSIFFKKFNNPSIQFLRVLTKNTNSLEILRKSSKILKRFLKKIAKNALFTLEPAGIFPGEARSTKGVLVRGSPRGGFRGAEPPGRRRSFQKVCKKSMKNYNF